MSQRESDSQKATLPADDAANSATTNDSDDPKHELLALPDVPLQVVVSYIPLQSLITTLPLIHPRVSTFREIALNQNRHLILHIGDREGIEWLKQRSLHKLPYARHLVDLTTGKPLYPGPNTFHQLYLNTLQYSTVDQLKQHMPDISHLEVFIWRVDIFSIPYLICLLTFWSPTLVSLKLHAQFNNGNPTPRERSVVGYSLLRLIDSINTTLSSLLHLTLDLHDRLFEENEAVVTLPMPILGQLREFYMQSDDSQQFIVETLRNYATETLQEVGIFLYGTWDSFLESFPAGTHLASTFVDLPFDLAPTEEEDDQMDDEALFLLETRFLRTFINLRVYAVELSASCPLSVLPTLLSPLHQLTTLDIVVYSPEVLSCINLPNWHLLTPLKSVQILKMNLPGDEATHDDTISPLWAHLFPSVQIFVLYHLAGTFCTVCHAEWEEDQPINDEEVKTALPCIKKYLAPLTVLPSLRKMFYSRHDGNLLEFSSTADFVQELDYFE